MKKLTLSARPEVIAMAKRVASDRGTSVSKLFSSFVESIAAPDQKVLLPRKTRAATGLVRLPKGKTDRELVADAMAQRHQR